MGKPPLVVANSSQEPRRSQRNKNLEEIRRNALAAKRKLRSSGIVQKNRTTLQKTLNQFAVRRREFDDAVQSHNTLLLNSSRNEEEKSEKYHSPFVKSEDNRDKKKPKPLILSGFFRAGVKGKESTRTLTSAERLRLAVLNNDALQILQSGNFIRPKPRKSPDIDPLTKMEISKVLKEFTDSSDTDDPVEVDNLKSSPVFKSFKKRATAVKSNSNEVIQNVHSQKNKFFYTKHIAKEDKCKRRLFEEENPVVNNRNSKNSNHGQYEANDVIRYSQRKSTPENVIYFSEYVPAKDLDNTFKKDNHRINPTDPVLIRYYIETCRMIDDNEFKNVFKNFLEDPLQNAKAALRTTYAKAFKDCLNRQKDVKSKHRSQSVDLCSESSSSEIMVEPDSAIARTLKKNKVLQIQNVQNTRGDSYNNLNSAINYNDLEKVQSTKGDSYNNYNTVINYKNAEKDFPNVETDQNQLLKRKYATSSKSGYSDIEAPSSVKVNVDSDSERMTMKMDFVHPDRQELTARYLNDVEVNSQQELTRCNTDNQRDFEAEFNHRYEQKKQLHVNDKNVKEPHFVSKGTKHVPAILRKNRPVVDCVSEEKNLLRIEKGPERIEITKQTLIRDNSTSCHNVMSERTPNCSNLPSNQLMEAPKCKYVYMNAKYNQPPRITAPVQLRRLQRNPSSQKMHLFSVPHESRNNFILSQNLELSPIEKQVSFSDDLDDFQMFQLSQGSSKEIQEKTKCLTLHSSQNCSEDSVDQMFTAPNNHCISYSDSYYGQCDPSNNHVSYNPQKVVHSRGSKMQACDVMFNPNTNCHSQGVIKCKDYQMQPLENHAFQGNDNHDFCVINNPHMYKNHQSQSSMQYQNPIVNCMQKQNTRQPVKFIAIEGNRMPQRRPIYSVEDVHGCSHTHKPSASSQQYNEVINPCYQTAMSEQARCTVSSIPCHSREVIKYNNVQREPSFAGNEFAEAGRNVMNFAPNSMSEQNFVFQRNMPMHRDVHNQRYIGPLPVRLPSPVCTRQVANQQHNHCSNNEVYRVNDIYLQEMNHNIHQNRQ